MSLFFTASDKELLEVRNKIFLTYGVPELFKNNFVKAPFSTSWYGRNNLQDFTYEFCRLTPTSQLEQIVVHISRGDRWIKVFLNIFQLDPALQSIHQLNGVNGLYFHLPPSILTQMRLRLDDIKTIPLFSYDFMFGGHKIARYYSKAGFERSIARLSRLIEKDLTNINDFVDRWHEIHQSKRTTWEGQQI